MREENPPSKLKDILKNMKPWIRSCHREEMVLVHLRIGHTRLIHEYLIKRGTPPQCLTCDTLKNILEVCPKSRIIFTRIGAVALNENHNNTLLKSLQELDLLSEL